ncbi:ABC transporter ATP-binding protein [Corynebacterium halotolerans]|uniref:ABC transporter ATP-binding protein n=1 Tax=Corynebacterium halotolerans YIM 70093 = DSM 44683 TaxID=1121362 RepID=M1NME8_9CORY|nr:ABC transporter ATP-binding protein [Corynebacterium halotolerans]AGF72523.1 ABC transporter ATP-binding protein [Corynebacterium halotolerans YIM 70093 = DSM 44683]
MTATFDGSGRSDEPALELRDVVKNFGTTTAVNQLTLTAQRGQVLSLLGPNGAGKTTTIEMCEGFVRPTSGHIRVLGLDPATQPDQVRRRIGIMLQGGGSYSGIRVGEMLQLAAAYNDNPHDPDWLIEVLGLEGVRRTTYRRLSGGQQQRLSLALALIGRPELIFLDEPTAGMDAQSRLAVWELIAALRRDGVTVILTTHLMDEAEALADHIVIIDRGAVVAEGSPAELTSADDRGTDRLTFQTDVPLDTPRADAALGRVCGEVPAIQATRPLHYSLPGAATPQLIAALTSVAAEQGVLVRRLDVAHRNLEEVFLDLTGRSLRS